ncbi:MAG: hypothetical protein ABFD94_01820 [Armatimonadia bacterium]
MAIDPGIIGNVMVPQAPQLPDVNAMMQTRTAGMENIYKIETARQQQAKAEAAAQAAAQEDALVEALLPAYTYGIETGDMAGALDLVPPEMQASVLPYVQALEGKPPEQVRAALIGSLSSSKAGQAALAAMQRAATLGVQQGQLDVSRQRLALDAQPPQMTPYQEAQIALERDKLAASQDKPMPGKVDVKAAAKADDTLDKILSAYKRLNDLSAITSTKRSGVENLAATASAKTGSTLGAAVGSEAQTQRQIIKNLRQALLNDIKAATGMSSKAIDSNVELQSFLNSLGDPENQSYEAAVTTIGELSAKYAGGRLSGTAEEMLRKTPQTAPAPGAIPQITTDEEYAALPSGAVYIDPNGQQRTKR